MSAHFRPRWKVLLICLLVTALAAIPGCVTDDPVGAIDYDADLAYLSPEVLTGEEGVGIVYRRVEDTSAFLAGRDRPVLILLSDRFGALNRTATLLLEQLAYEYQGVIACLRAESSEHPDLMAFCQAGSAPCFALAEKGVLLRTTGGLSAIDEQQVRTMLEGLVSTAG